MNVKRFIVGGIVGGIVDFLAGWVFYGMLFKDNFGGGDPENMLFIFLGCMSFGFFMSFVFAKWAHIATGITGLKAGAVFGMFTALMSNFFNNSNTLSPNLQLIALDLGIMIVMGAIVGSAIGIVNGKVK